MSNTNRNYRLINDGDDQSSNNKDKQKEHEKFGLKVLDFLDNTGITAIPQSDLDAIANRINRNKGTLGLNKDFNINTFFNPIAGEPENKIDIKNFYYVYLKIINPTPIPSPSRRGK